MAKVFASIFSWHSQPATTMMSLESVPSVRIDQPDCSSKPFALNGDFLTGRACGAVGYCNLSKTSHAYVVLSNSHDEIWLVCNRHSPAYALLADDRAFVLTMRGTARQQMALV